MYRKLMEDMSNDTLHIKQQWEMELNIIIDKDLWEDICSKCHRGIGSQYWKEFDWKVKIRFFRTPLKTFMSKSSPKDRCWRNCGILIYFGTVQKYRYFGKTLKKNWKKFWEETYPWTLYCFYQMCLLITYLLQSNVIYCIFC